MTYSEYINTDDFIRDLEADEDFIGEVVQALREALYVPYRNRSSYIGARVESIAVSLHDVSLDNKGCGDKELEAFGLMVEACKKNPTILDALSKSLRASK